MVMTDIFGRYIHVANSPSVFESDKTMYVESMVGMQPSLYLSESEGFLADIGYAGIPHLEVPDKRDTNMAFPLRRARNKSIHGMRMVNEWTMGYVNNHYRIFPGRWPYSPELYVFTLSPSASWQTGASIGADLFSKSARSTRASVTGRRRALPSSHGAIARVTSSIFTVR